MDYFKFLPIEIALNILSRLPTESVLECKLVCTNWRNHVRHQSFKKMHLYHLNHPTVHSGKLGFTANTQRLFHFAQKFHYFEYNENHDESNSLPIQKIRRISLKTLVWDDTYPIGSCNGLICFAGGPFAWIYNPITREYVMLPEIKRESNFYRSWSSWTTGFGYLSSTNEYKILGIYTSETEYVEVYIYTLGSGNGWRKLENFYFQSCSHWHQGVLANEALYWLDSELKMIVYFDLAEEKFGEHLSPPPLPTRGRRDYTIGVLDGFLYIAVRDRLVDNFDLWMLKVKSVNQLIKLQEEYQSCLCIWSKEFRIDEKTCLAITKSDGVLTMNAHLNIYDTKTSTSKRLVKFNDELLRVFPHKNTLISMKELGEEGTKTMEVTMSAYVDIVDGEEVAQSYVEETTVPVFTIEQL